MLCMIWRCLWREMKGYSVMRGLMEILSTPGTAQVNADRQALREVIFDRTMESLYNTGDVDQYRMCEWGS